LLDLVLVELRVVGLVVVGLVVVGLVVVVGLGVVCNGGSDQHDFAYIGRNGHFNFRAIQDAVDRGKVSSAVSRYFRAGQRGAKAAPVKRQG
jgi:hypothetical protein